jgi:LysR family transcriptional regulator, low CO2-responsive transcriptional regulator
MRLSNAITMKQLRALAAIARGGSITAAAQKLGLTPPAIHAQIKALEALVEMPLLERSSDTAGSGLTVAGAAILDAAERIEVVLSQCEAQVQALSRGHSGRVTLGVVSTGKYFAPFLVKTLKTMLPEIEIVLRVGNRTAVVDELDRHAIDLGIMGRPPRIPEVVADVIGPHPHGIIAAPDHPLAGAETVEATDLLSEVFLARENGSGTRILMTRYLDRIGDGHVFDLVEMGTNETIKQAVMAGLGIALISLHTTTDEFRAGRLVTLDAPGLPIVRQWFLVRPSDKQMTPAAERVRQAIMSLEGGFLPK